MAELGNVGIFYGSLCKWECHAREVGGEVGETLCIKILLLEKARVKLSVNEY